jgi:hypothetical protein
MPFEYPALLAYGAVSNGKINVSEKQAACVFRI